MLMNLPGGILQNHVCEHRRVGLVRHMRTEADADVERGVEVQGHVGTDLVHRFAFGAEEKREIIAVLFQAEANGRFARVTGVGFETLRLLDVGVFRRALRHVNQPGAVQGGHGLLGIVLQILTNDEDGLCGQLKTVFVLAAKVMSAAREMSPETFFQRKRNSSRVYQML